MDEVGEAHKKPSDALIQTESGFYVIFAEAVFDLIAGNIHIDIDWNPDQDELVKFI